MGIFARKRAAEDLSYRLGVLFTEVENLKSAQKRIELEWEELYDKVRHQMSRMARRFSTEKKELGNGEEPLPDDSETSGMDPISAKIHERRNRGRLTP